MPRELGSWVRVPRRPAIAGRTVGRLPPGRSLRRRVALLRPRLPLRRVRALRWLTETLLVSARVVLPRLPGPALPLLLPWSGLAVLRRPLFPWVSLPVILTVRHRAAPPAGDVRKALNATSPRPLVDARATGRRTLVTVPVPVCCNYVTESPYREGNQAAYGGRQALTLANDGESGQFERHILAP